ncbi:MAG: hypothetical protein JSW02_03435 [candidate division WOR-3 bacterium]|nr:MAG: hypothetical protein JSW02_03435 [candidate division WOR-3 bacterium]
MKLWKLMSLAVMLLLILSACDTVSDEPNGNGTGEYQSITVDNITLQWRTDTLGNLDVIVSAPTTGWVSVGFDPTIGMEDANIIIGYVSGDTAYARDDYGTGINTHEPDIDGGGEDNILELGGTETAGTTEISFLIPLDSGDTRDRVLVIGNTYDVILAYGEDDADDFDSYHQARTTSQIDL